MGEEIKDSKTEDSFEDRYKEFLNALYLMSCKKQEERNLRWSKFQSYFQSEELAKDAFDKLDIAEKNSRLFPYALKTAICTVEKKVVGENFLNWLKMMYKQEEIQDRYKEFIQEIFAQPIECRYKWFREDTRYDEFVLDILKAMNEEAYKNLEHRLRVTGVNNNEISDFEDFDVASYGEIRKIDSLIFIKTIQSFVKEYSLEKELPVMWYMRKRYKQLASRETADRKFQEDIVPHPEIPKELRVHVCKLVNKAKTTIESCGECTEKYSRENMKRFILELIDKENYPSTIVGKIERIVDMVYQLNPVYLDNPLEDGEGNVSTGKNELSDGQDWCEKIEDTENEELFSKRLADIIENWEEIEALIIKKQKPQFKTFLTRDMLVVLKLRLITELTREAQRVYRENGLKPEPYCKSWCQRSDICAEKNGAGCYIRYMEMPPTNMSVFDLLSECGNTDKLYENILNQKYLEKAFGKNIVSRMNDVMLNYLDREFDFSNEKIAEVLGKNASSISRYKQNYMGAKQNLYKYFTEG